MQDTDTTIADDTGYPTIRLLARRHKRVKAGHPWVYANEIEMTTAARALPPGGLVNLENAGGEPLGTAAFNPRTLVVARLLGPTADAPVDHDFLVDRLTSALRLRDRLFDRPFYRLVHAEADGLPGLIVDRFDDVVVCQENTAAMQRLEPALLDALDAVLSPRVVVLRNDSPARALEGLDNATRVAKGDLDDAVMLEENGVRFFADVEQGQKTGWFFDQRDNRAFMAGLAKDARVLDLYCHSGGFGIQAAVAGAHQVTLVDRSAPALELAARAAAANEVDGRCHFERHNAFEIMSDLAKRKERFDIVIADPPAFVKSRKDLNAGTRGYRKMTRLAAKLVAPGGFLFVASCSHNLDTETFATQVRRGIEDAGRQGRILRSTGAAPDHPLHPHLPESAYLKAQVLNLD